MIIICLMIKWRLTDNHLVDSMVRKAVFNVWGLPRTWEVIWKHILHQEPDLGVQLYCAIHHLGSILEVGGHGWVAHSCVGVTPPSPPPQTKVKHTKPYWQWSGLIESRYNCGVTVTYAVHERFIKGSRSLLQTSPNTPNIVWNLRH